MNNNAETILKELNINNFKIKIKFKKLVEDLLNYENYGNEIIVLDHQESEIQKAS